MPRVRPNRSESSGKERTLNNDMMAGATRRIVDDKGDVMTYTVGSGNVFADLGVDQPEEHLAKAHLVGRITDAIAARDVTHLQAAEILGVPPTTVSALLRGDGASFSLERLFRLLVALDNDIDIVVAPKSGEHGHVSVVER